MTRACQTRQKESKYSIFSHPDFTVGAGITPAHAFARGLYHRYGLSPFPKDMKFEYHGVARGDSVNKRRYNIITYARISETTPEPTVLPPSRIAKRRPFSHATGVISSTVMSTLSPGRHISTPAGSSMVPVTSVVLK